MTKNSKEVKNTLLTKNRFLFFNYNLRRSNFL